jgi:hypothetical protein
VTITGDRKLFRALPKSGFQLPSPLSRHPYLVTLNRHLR